MLRPDCGDVTYSVYYMYSIYSLSSMSSHAMLDAEKKRPSGVVRGMRGFA